MRALLLCAALAVPCLASAASVTPIKTKSPSPPGARDYRLSISLKLGDLEHQAAFVVGEGSQTNYVDGGEVPLQMSQGVTLKKWTAIVNALIFARGKDGAAVQLQTELSGPHKRDPKAANDNLTPIEALQWDGAFNAELGKPVVLLEGPGRRIEATVTLAP